MAPKATPLDEREDKTLGDELPMLVREFEIIEMTPASRAKKKGKAKDAAEKKDGAKDPKKKADDPEEDDATDDVDDPDAEEDDDAEDGDRAGKAAKRGASEGDGDGEAAGKRDDELFDITISSEYPVQRWFGREILDHSPESVDLSRAALGLSFLDSHDAPSIIGIVDGVRVRADKKLAGQVRFSRSGKAQQVKQDIQDKIRRFISVGYGVSEYALEKSSDTEGDTYRATRWTPMEVSSVGVPADPTVGANRAARARGDRMYPVKVRSSSDPASKPNLKEGTVANEPVETVESRNGAAAEIIRLGKLHGIEHEHVVRMVSEGMSVEKASRTILEEVAKRAAKPLTQPSAEGADRIDLTEREQKEYNIARGIMAAVKNVEAGETFGGKRENTFELEISAEIEKRHTGEAHGGLFVPWSIRHAWTPELQKKYGPLLKTRAGLSSNVSGEGQELKYTEPGEFILFLYNSMRVKELGARTIAGLRDNVSYPKQTGRATGSWVGENPGSDVADSALALGTIGSQPHTYQSSSSYSRQLLAQAVIDVDTLVREDLAIDLALAIDTAAISGSGSSNQPTGILNTSGVQSYVVEGDSGNGGAPVWDDIVKMQALLESVNADQLGKGGWLTTPGCKSKLKRTARLGNTIGLPIWADDDTVDGKASRATNQVSSSGTKGTSGATLSTLIYGVFETMIIGMWGSGFEMVVDPYRLKKQGMIELTTFMLTDITLKYPVAFAVATDCVTS